MIPACRAGCSGSNPDRGVLPVDDTPDLTAFSILRSLRAIDVNDSGPGPDQDIHDDGRLILRRIRISVDQTRRYVEEVSRTHVGHEAAARTVLETKTSCDEGAVQMPTSVMMPHRQRAAHHFGPPKHDSAGLKGLAAEDALRRGRSLESVTAD
jgi:hypothetical protein